MPREDEPQDERRRWGQLLEDAIAQRVSEIEKRPVQRVKQTLVSKQYPFMLAHLDRAMPHNKSISRWNEHAGKLNNTYAIIELKNAASDWQYGDAGTDDVPTHYLVQCVHQMIVTGVPLCILAVLFYGSDLRRYPITLNDDTARMVIEGERAFWQMVQEGVEPPRTTLADVKLAYPVSKSVSKEATPDIAALLTRYTAVRDEVESFSREKDAIEAQVKDFMGEADTLTVYGVPVLTWKTGKARTMIDAERLRAEMPDIASRYEKTGAQPRTFRLKTSKD